MIDVCFVNKYWFGWKRNYKRSLPTCYRDMNARQFSALVRLTKGFISDEQFYREYLSVPTKVLRQIDPFQLYMLTNRLRIDDKMLDCFVIKHLGKCLAPEDKLRNMSFQQFITVDQFFGWYSYTDKRAYLNLMLANLYIEKGKDFFTGDVEKRLEQVKKMTDAEIFPAVVNWMLVKNWLAHSYKEVFPSSPTTSVVTVNGKQKKQKPGNWLEVFDALVGDNLAFIDEYKHIACMDALRILNSKIKKQHEK